MKKRGYFVCVMVGLLGFCGASRGNQAGGMVMEVGLDAQLSAKSGVLEFWLQQGLTKYELPYEMVDADTARVTIGDEIPVGSYELFGIVGDGSAVYPEMLPLDAAVEVLSPTVVSVEYGALTSGQPVTLKGLYFGSEPVVHFYPIADSEQKYICPVVPGSFCFTNEYETGHPVGAMDVDTGESRVEVTMPTNLPVMLYDNPRFSVVCTNKEGTIFTDGYTNEVRGQLFGWCVRDTLKTSEVYDYLVDSLAGGKGGVFRKIIQALLYVTKLHDQSYRYNLDLYTVLYWTIDGDGNLIPASGVIALPEGLTNAPLCSFQHGTMLTKAEAPSMANGAEMAFAVTYASAEGFITSIPDHTGLGVAAQLYTNLYHPYCQRVPLAKADADMIIALRQFLVDGFTCGLLSSGRTLDGTAYLAGYSEGGYATMALQRELESHLGEYGAGTLVTTTPLSGPYALTQVMLPRMLTDEPFTVPYFAPYLLVTMNDDYHLYKSGADYLAEPYASTVPPLIDGYHSSTAVSAAMPSDSIIKESLRTNILEELSAQIGAFYMGVRENDLVGLTGDAAWKPVAPMLLVHGETDDCVLYGDSVVATNYFLGEMGCTNVALLTVPDNPLIEAGKLAGESTHVLYAPFVVGEAWSYMHDVHKNPGTPLPPSHTVDPPTVSEEEERDVRRMALEVKEVQK